MFEIPKSDRLIIRDNDSPNASNFVPAARVVNLSNHTFSKKELNVLNKGMKFAPRRKVSESDIKSLAADCEVALRKEPLAAKHRVAEIIRTSMNDSTPGSALSSCTQFQRSTLRMLRDTIKKEDLVIQKADKGNSVVVLDKQVYVDKCLEFLNSNNIVPLMKDPTSKFQSEVKNAVCKSEIFSAGEKRYLIQMNPSAPRLYGLPKLHKCSIPIRPVVSAMSSPSHILSRKINVLFREYTGFIPKFGVKNSIELAEKLKDISIPQNARLISFDINNLFTCVPKAESVLRAQAALNNATTPKKLSKELISLINMVINQNYFSFNNRFYIQSDGLAMGSPLSPLLAELFLDSLEETLFNSQIQHLKNIVYWHRYVDDILCLWTGTNRQLDSFLNHLNSLHPKISFSMEKDANGTINFLDLTINITGGRHEFSIYRKPTYTDHIIPNDSVHHFSHKHAAFHSMIHRLLHIPLSPSNFNMELTTIFKIATNNGYSPNLIQGILRKKQKAIAIQRISSQAVEQADFKWCSLPFLGDISYKISNHLPSSLRAAFYPPITLSKLLNNGKDKPERFQKSGIYKLKCNGCNMGYVGQTGRNFSIRSKEHARCFKNKDPTSLFAKHLLDFNHTSDFVPEILHTLPKGLKMDALELIEIRRHLANPNTPICNEQLFPNSSPLLSEKLTLKNPTLSAN
jgi:hypothetical protein